jgi:dienelactone hydrolase
MNAAGADWQLIVYGGAAHGFTDQGDPGTPGAAYDPAADARSFLAITAFLREVLGSATQPPVGGLAVGFRRFSGGARE